MQGRIVKGIAGFYYVYVEGSGIYECKAKGIFRKEKKKPLVGDFAEIQELDSVQKKGNLEAILPRKNALIRPLVANVDQVLLVFSMQSPKPNFYLLDVFLLGMKQLEIPILLCFNKADLSTKEEQEEVARIYENSGCHLFFHAATQEGSQEKFCKELQGKTTVMAGPSGVGKSTLMNQLQQEVHMEIGEISEKIQRGKHTTRHAQLLWVAKETYVVDTPGFTSFTLENMKKEEVSWYYPEFQETLERCRFQGCSHIHEPDCVIQKAVKKGMIAMSRYENYKMIYEEQNEKEKRRY